MKKKQKGFSTLAIHAGQIVEPQTGSLTTPIYQTSTFVFDSLEDGAQKFAGEKPGYIYSRLGNPTVALFEQKMAALENGEAALAFSSGMGAISALMIGLIKSGEHILCSRGLYGCAYGLLVMLKERFGVEFSLVDMRDEQQVANAIQPNTRLIYIETPINPTLEMADLRKISKLAKQHNAKLIVDNTFMTPYLQRPLEMGADFVVHSATKYIGGHGDLIAGVAVGSKREMDRLRQTTLKDVGSALGPNEAFLLNRGLKTLSIRMDRHCANALEVAKFLEKHPRVKSVYYPGLATFRQYELGCRQLNDFGGLVSFEIEGGTTQVAEIINQLKMIKIAVSLGDADSLIQHPATMTHAVVPPEVRAAMGISDGLIRLSVGIEDVEDIIDDLNLGLK
ncbi:methionine gamma-lyase [Ammoniphilus oxalaticus]|uniref:L-methionine gamma-lyase n=1 Tax=Ammoniphilus oxalaticus TaxID=66863 RepID=A0A419SFP8_9BACL|nr:methionine gamma-lyase [Ammoniphilus oxalaticus]RKD22614.1 methionine gamma-lyase [Ammoniphilus oxalaticus]